MNPKQYVEEIVLPTVREFRDEPRSRRRAYQACEAAYHITHYLEKNGWPKGHVRETMRLFDRQGPYDIIQAICNASKHCGHDRRHSVPFVIGSDYERPPAVAGLAIVGLSRVGDRRGGREIPLNADGVDIYESVSTALKHFQFFFPELGDVDLSDL